MSSSLVIAGAIITVLGIIFAAQGKGILGPRQSFMVNNPRWIIYGSAIAIIGLIMMLVSLFTSKPLNG